MKLLIISHFFTLIYLNIPKTDPIIQMLEPPFSISSLHFMHNRSKLSNFISKAQQLLFKHISIQLISLHTLIHRPPFQILLTKHQHFLAPHRRHLRLHIPFENPTVRQQVNLTHIHRLRLKIQSFQPCHPKIKLILILTRQIKRILFSIPIHIVNRERKMFQQHKRVL